MEQKDFELQMKEAAKKYENGHPAQKPSANFVMGAKWAASLLTQAGTELYYINQLREQIKSRRATDAEPWLETTIRTAAQVLVDIDELRADIRKNGRIWEEQGYNLQKKKVVNPELAHLKDMMRTMAIYYESLGLSFKSTPSKMKESAKVGADEDDPLTQFMEGINGARQLMNEIPEDFR